MIIIYYFLVYVHFLGILKIKLLYEKCTKWKSFKIIGAQQAKSTERLFSR